jgi:hypothetical protein
MANPQADPRNGARPLSFPFHAKYAGQWAAFSIEELKMIEGEIPRRAISLVLEWAFQHRDEPMANWEKAQKKEPLEKIKPLD